MGCLVVETFTSHGLMYTQAISKALEDRVPGGGGGGGGGVVWLWKSSPHMGSCIHRLLVKH